MQQPCSRSHQVYLAGGSASEDSRIIHSSSPLSNNSLSVASGANSVDQCFSIYLLVVHLQQDVLAELHGDLFSRHASPLEGHIFVVVDDRGEDVLSTRFVVDATENSKEGGVAAEVYSPQTGL